MFHVFQQRRGKDQGIKCSRKIPPRLAPFFRSTEISCMRVNDERHPDLVELRELVSELVTVSIGKRL